MQKSCRINTDYTAQQDFKSIKSQKDALIAQIESIRGSFDDPELQLILQNLESIDPFSRKLDISPDEELDQIETLLSDYREKAREVFEESLIENHADGIVIAFQAGRKPTQADLNSLSA